MGGEDPEFYVDGFSRVDCVFVVLEGVAPRGLGGPVGVGFAALFLGYDYSGSSAWRGCVEDVCDECQ